MGRRLRLALAKQALRRARVWRASVYGARKMVTKSGYNGLQLVEERGFAITIDRGVHECFGLRPRFYSARPEAGANTGKI